jgi:hypothetical protein
MWFGRSVRLIVLCLASSFAATHARAQVPVGDVSSSDASVKGSVMLSAGSTRVLSGSSVSAGVSNASVRLLRGGELRICQGSSITLTSSPSGQEVMVGMSSGTIEAHYPLAGARDSILTPDFQISLNGPGAFHLAVSADDRGNTCVQTQHGNTGVVSVSELMGDASYTLRPDEQIIFRAGHIANAGQVAANCGCPPAIAVERASAEPVKPPPVTNAAASPPPPVVAMMASPPAPPNLTSPPPLERPGDVHVQVEAPFVFRASEPPLVRDAPVDLAELRLSSLPSIPPVSVQPPPENPPAAAQVAQGKPARRKRHGFWGFLASIFKG